MKLKDMRLDFTIFDGEIWFGTTGDSGRSGVDWWIDKCVWGKGTLFVTKRQAIAFAKLLCKAFNDAQEAKK